MEEQETSRSHFVNMPTFDYKTVNDVINILQKIKEEHGDLPIMNEYDASYWIGGTIRVDSGRNPDNYLGPRIKVVEFI